MTERLASLISGIRACAHCAERFSATPTGHAPRPVIQADSRARICIAGQAPGVRVHKSGRPFTDPSGDRLRQWMGVDERVFYDPARLAIIPMAFCFPGHDAKGGDKPPPRECAKIWRTRLFEAMPGIELILLVGRYAQAWHAPELMKLRLADAVRARGVRVEGGALAIPLPHPSWRNNAWLKRNPWFETEILPWLRTEIADRLP